MDDTEPDLITAQLSGALGDEVQARMLTQAVEQHVDLVLGRIKFLGAADVAVNMDGATQPIIYQP
jgi:hypothetical protein